MSVLLCLVNQSLLADVTGCVRRTISGSCGITNDIRCFRGKCMVVSDHNYYFFLFPIQVDTIYFQGKIMESCEWLSPFELSLDGPVHQSITAN